MTVSPEKKATTGSPSTTDRNAISVENPASAPVAVSASRMTDSFSARSRSNCSPPTLAK
jgi:hypothetical protein